MPFGFGNFGCGAGPAGGVITPPGVVPTTLVGSWSIDPVLQKYLFEANGNPLAMDGTTQRVYVLVCQAQAAWDAPIITPQILRKQEAAIRDALRPLVNEGAISNIVVNATDDGRSETLKAVTYKNLGTNASVTLKIR